MKMSSPTPLEIAPESPTEMRLAWTTGQRYAVPNLELRFLCPCAGCVDERTGERTHQRETLAPDVRATRAQLVGRYALQITWSDGHDTGMYPFERLYEICRHKGRELENRAG
jgi:DUF971 family protein